MTNKVEGQPACRNCAGMEWVCENHADHPWSGLTGEAECCGGAGAPCPVCNMEMACAGYVDAALRAQNKALRAKLDALANELDYLVNLGGGDCLDGARAVLANYRENTND